MSLKNLWSCLTCKTVYHVASQGAVTTIHAGVNPGNNAWAQYGRGFYTFAKRKDASIWQQLRPQLMNTTEAHVIIEFRIKRRVWKQLRRKVIHEEYNWRIPAEWLNKFDVLEGPWGVTPDTLPLQGAWQYKFNPHTYFILNDAIVREGEQ